MSLYDLLKVKFAPASTIYAVRDSAAGAPTDNTTSPLRVDANGNLMTAQGLIPSNDSSTGLYTNFPLTAFTGKQLIKNGAGRLRDLVVGYTAATGSGLFIQLHNAAAIGDVATGTLLRPGWPINSTTTLVERDFLEPPIAMTTGVSVAFSSTQNTYTAAAAETGVVFARYK
jgi:hypothetical protein